MSGVAHAMFTMLKRFRFLRRWPQALLVLLSAPILLAIGLVCDGLYYHWRVAIDHTLGGRPLPPLTQLVIQQIEMNTGVFLSVFLSFALLLLVWFLYFAVFLRADQTASVRFLYGFAGIWLVALMFLASLLAAAAVPFLVGAQRVYLPPPAAFSTIALQMPFWLAVACAALAMFGIARKARWYINRKKTGEADR